MRHRWTFDPTISAAFTQGLDANGDGRFSPDELKDLARENTESLVEHGYYTQLKANGVKQEFDAPRDPAMAHEKDSLVLSFLLPLKSPASAGKALALEVFDPAFFVAVRPRPRRRRGASRRGAQGLRRHRDAAEAGRDAAGREEPVRKLLRGPDRRLGLRGAVREPGPRRVSVTAEALPAPPAGRSLLPRLALVARRGGPRRRRDGASPVAARARGAAPADPRALRHGPARGGACGRAGSARRFSPCRAASTAASRPP